MKQSENTDAQWKGKRKTHFFSVQKVFPILCAYNHSGLAIEVSGKLGRGRFCLDWVLWGEGSRVRRRGLSKGVLTALNRTAAEQQHHIRRRTSMQLGETHIPMCHDKQRLCVNALNLHLL